MIRIFVFLVVVAAIAALAVFITDAPGQVEIAWGDYLVTTSPGVLVAAVALVAAAAILLFMGLRYLWIGPGRLARARRLRRERLGYRALTQGLVAAAAGDARGARRLARRANLLLDEPPLTLLLSAQAAQLEGDAKTAEGYFEAMLARRETAFLGLRGLLVQANKAGDSAAALDYAERAYRLRPETPWVLTALLELQTQAGRWPGALETAKQAERHGALTTEAAHRRQASLLYTQAKQLHADGDSKAAGRIVQRALSAEPTFLPAVCLAITLAKESGRTSMAARLATDAWSRAPHPEVGALFLALHDDAPALDRLKRVEKLVASNPEHIESQLLQARAALDAKLWGTARKHLEAAAAARPSAGTYRMMAALEEAEHGDAEAARGWLLKASESPPDPAWTCGRCGMRAQDWTIACGACGGLDTLEWRAAAAPEPPSLSEGGATPPPLAQRADEPFAAGS